MKKIIVILVAAVVLSAVWLSCNAQKRIMEYKPGTYSGFTAHSNTYYKFDSGAYITSSIEMDSVISTTFSNLVYVSKGGTVFSTQKGGNVNDSCLNCNYGHASVAYQGDVKPFITYNGNPYSCIWYGLYDYGGKIQGGMLYSGTWEANTLYHNVCIQPKFINTTVTNDSTGSNTKIFGHSIYGLLLVNPNITGPTPPSGDNGVVYIWGNAQILNGYRQKGYGRWMRIWEVELHPMLFPQDSYIVNCIDANTSKYGSLDCRIDSGYFATGKFPLTGGDAYFLNNTVVNKRDIEYRQDSLGHPIGTGYWTPAVECGAYITIHIKNNFTGNGQYYPGKPSSLYVDMGNGTNRIDTANNIVLPNGIPIPVGYIGSDYYPYVSPLTQKGSGAIIVVTK